LNTPGISPSTSGTSETPVRISLVASTFIELFHRLIPRLQVPARSMLRRSCQWHTQRCFHWYIRQFL
jgi:hypothetical protein